MKNVEREIILHMSLCKKSLNKTIWKIKISRERSTLHVSLRKKWLNKTNLKDKKILREKHGACQLVEEVVE